MGLSIASSGMTPDALSGTLLDRVMIFGWTGTVGFLKSGFLEESGHRLRLSG
jgi:hypothetical protein